MGARRAQADGKVAAVARREHRVRELSLAVRDLVAEDPAHAAGPGRIRQDVSRHVADIAERYLVPGETQAPAIMYVPSESMYAELHASFPETLRRARQSQVIVVSPHIFMLVIGTIQSLMRDAKMREQAHAIQAEVGALLDDVRRLGDRILDLRKHFDTTNKDIGQIEISLRGIDRHAERIAQVDLGDQPQQVQKISSADSKDQSGGK